MRLQYLSVLAALSSLALADFKFTSPAAGSSVAAGAVSVQWEDDGTSPALSTLSTYTLYLMVGGNDADDMLQLWASDGTGTVSSGGTTAQISSGLAGSTQNGFFWKVLAVATEGGTLTAYSTRFTLTGMTGQTPTTYATAVTALGGSTEGPQGENNIANAATGTAAGTGEFTVPYQLQTGLTKYAPMQPVPPTKITAKSFTPLHPTSAYTIATTWVAHPSIVTTLTASQTFSASSMENTAAAQSQPSGDMAKFLARWKD